MEPLVGNEAAIDLDYHSSESRMRALYAMFDSKQPSLTDRLSLVREEGAVSRCGAHNGPSYGVVLMHPGIELTEPQETDLLWPRDFASIVLCIPDLLERSITDNQQGSLVYIHDMSHPSGDPVFLGGARVEVIDNNSSDATQTIDYLDEESLDALTARIMFRSNVQAANRIWAITILSMDGTYEPDLLFVYVAATLVLLSSILVTVWIGTHAFRTARYQKIVKTAARSAAIVSSIFPETVAKRMMEEEKGPTANEPNANEQGIDDKPFADLFPDCTVMFGDMAGFTVWSSMRDPNAVFHLLESIFGAFDRIAEKMSTYTNDLVLL